MEGLNGRVYKCRNCQRELPGSDFYPSQRGRASPLCTQCHKKRREEGAPFDLIGTTQMLYKAFSEMPQFTADDVAKLLGIRCNGVGPKMRAVIRDGSVVRINHGVYRFSSAPTQQQLDIDNTIPPQPSCNDTPPMPTHQPQNGDVLCIGHGAYIIPLSAIALIESDAQGRASVALIVPETDKAGTVTAREYQFSTEEWNTRQILSLRDALQYTAHVDAFNRIAEMEREITRLTKALDKAQSDERAALSLAEERERMINGMKAFLVQGDTQR